MDPLATAIAFGALGANVLATALLLLFNPRSAAVRWYAAFLTAMSAWLLSQGALAMGASPAVWRPIFGAAVQLLPPLFLAAALVHGPWPTRLPWAAAGLGVLLLPVTVPSLLSDSPGAITVVWHAAGWGLGAWLQARARKRRFGPAGAPPYASRLLAVLLVAPLLVVAGLAVGADDFFVYVMPPITLGVHFAIFGGVVWLRYYDIEVRAARSGDIAGHAAEAERLAAVGEVAASIAHEVRNPLAGVRSLAQRMAEEDVEPERWRRYAAVIMEESGRMDRIIGNLLTVARRSPPRPWDGVGTDLGTLFDDLALLTTARAERAGVRIRTDAGGLTAPAPREPLAQALLNLLLNAIHHSPPGGTVRLAARPAGEPAGEPAVQGVRIVVRDQGPGVPAAERELIFEPFHSAGTDGTGLGLSVVRRLARELGWTVEVRDAAGGGAEFVLSVRRPHPAEVPA